MTTSILPAAPEAVSDGDCSQAAGGAAEHPGGKSVIKMVRAHLADQILDRGYAGLFRNRPLGRRHSFERDPAVFDLAAQPRILGASVFLSSAGRRADAIRPFLPRLRGLRRQRYTQRRPRRRRIASALRVLMPVISRTASSRRREGVKQLIGKITSFRDGPRGRARNP